MITLCDKNGTFVFYHELFKYTFRSSVTAPAFTPISDFGYVYCSLMNNKLVCIIQKVFDISAVNMFSTNTKNLYQTV